MDLRTTIVSQFRRPAGPLGRLAGWTMANRPSNRYRNRCTIELLELEPQDRVLEIGYGPGVAIDLASRSLTRGRIFGLDHSAVMYRQAARRNGAGIAAGKVVLGLGDVLEPPFPLPSMDKIYSVNVVQFWPDPQRVVRALKALLKPGGRIVTTFMPRVGNEKAKQAIARARGLEQIMQEIGFDGLKTHWLAHQSTPAFCLVARLN